MIPIIIIPIVTIALLFFLGIGVTTIVVPKKIRVHSIWIIPWVTITLIIFFLTLLSLLGLPVKQSMPIVTFFLLAIDVYVWIKKKLQRPAHIVQDIILTVFIIGTVFFNISPLLKTEKQLTTLSLGNNDAIVYVMSPDYLLNHSILDNFTKKPNTLKPAEASVTGLIQSSYRFGPPMITAFFLPLFDLKAYQFFTIFQAVIFALSIPLVYLVLKVLYKPSTLGLVIISILIGFNANLLYIIYHDFFGQVLFWGISLCLLIYFLFYFETEPKNSKSFTYFDAGIGFLISILFLSYHEGAIFVLAPLVILLGIRFILKKNSLKYWFSLTRIGMISIILMPFAIANGMVLGLEQAGNTGGPIGWQLFRSNIPYANPFEMLGFYSIHSFDPLPSVVAATLSSLVVLLIMIGFYHSKNKLLMLSLVIIYLGFLIWTGPIDQNFFTYNRVVTYTLPLFIVLFAIGLLEAGKKMPRQLGGYVIVALLALTLYSGIQLNKRYLREFISIDRSLISLQELHDSSIIQQPIYTEQALTGLTSLWRQMWIEYFLYPNKSLYSPFNLQASHKTKIKDGSLILLSKTSIVYPPPSILYTDTMWENQYFKLVTICNSDQCLLRRKENLSLIKFKDSSYEDSLLIDGWSLKEKDHRWTDHKTATIRFITQTDTQQMIVEVESLKQPQMMKVFINNKLAGQASLTDIPEKYTFPLGQLPGGIHKIRFEFSHTYKPTDISKSDDTRDLAADFTLIQLK